MRWNQNRSDLDESAEVLVRVGQKISGRFRFQSKRAADAAVAVQRAAAAVSNLHLLKDFRVAKTPIGRLPPIVKSS